MKFEFVNLNIINMRWVPNLCRTCGQITETCHVIYDKDDYSSLEFKIRKCLNLNVLRNDYKPKQVCNNCFLRLNDFSEFIDISQATNQKYDTIYLSSCYEKTADPYEGCQHLKTSVIVSNKVQVNEHTENPSVDLYKSSCQLSEDVFEIIECNNYTSHNPCTDYVNSVPIQEEVCFQDLTIPPQEPVLNIDLNTNSNNSSENVINYSTSQHLSSSHVTPNVQCSYNEIDSLNYENQEIGNKKQIHTSDKLKYASVVLSADDLCHSVSIQEQRKPKDNEKDKVKIVYSCPHCDKKFRRRGTLNSHVAIHTNIRPHICNVCSKAFAVKCHLTTHRKVHTDEHKCKYCSKQFAVPSKLKRHIRIHMNDKPFMCNFINCNKSFSDKRNLDGHKLTHSVEKNYNCERCEKKFRSKNQLKQHFTSHNSRVIFTCNLCAKTYRYKNNLVCHMKRHKDFVCSCCKCDYKSKALLIEHLKICSARK